MAKEKEVTPTSKIRHGTAEWFRMVGTLMSEAASQAGLAPELTLSFVERYTDGAELSDGLVQGIRFDIVQGKPSFRIGARRDERADITVEVTAAAARQLNVLRSADAKFPATRGRMLSTGELKVDGDLSRMGKWMEDVHDPIVDRTG
ncbi:hypothetical protein [Pseudorhodoferax sp.]|uniref:hypothetical protein n=1 Tax=Pseudorhodoferax sp. TaxID=1993553 RepID=UPI0039E32545